MPSSDTGSSAANNHGLSIEDRIGSLFQPDTLLPEQYLDTFRRKVAFEPEKRLLLAILEDGINCFQDDLPAQSDKKRRLFEEAEQWIFGDHQGDWIFSFGSICGMLGLDPGYLRRGLKGWLERQVKATRGCRQPSAAGQRRRAA